jgi:transcriptional regulator with XRE-family HTH domain
MEASDENLAQFVTRLRSQRYPSRREADRETGIPYSTWQNIEIRGTLPTIEILTQLATALDVEEVDLVRAAKVTLFQKRENGDPK